ncbi:MAG TPA: SCO family protein [Candidatus Angelobacter sp.]|nr:SCO family protein [Candidatus Angelobacter sp.]
MPDVSRRKFFSFTAAAPLTAAVLSQSAAAAGTGSTAPVQKVWPPATQASARKRIQELHLPNLPLISHEGKRYLFYDDLVKDKAVSLNFFFANCDEICPLVTANLARVQKILGDQVGRDIYMYSFTLKPKEDTVDVIREYRAKYGAQPGWTFFTADPKDMEKLRAAIGFTYPDPVIDKDATQHIGNIRFGNEPLMYWSACPGMAHATWVAETLEYCMHPNDNLGPAFAGAKR